MRQPSYLNNYVRINDQTVLSSFTLVQGIVRTRLLPNRIARIIA